MRLWSESTTISATMVLGCQPRVIQRTTDEGLPADRLNRILTAVETIEESLGVLARKQQIDRKDYKNDSGARDIVERRFVKMTEAAIDIDEGLVKHERGQPPASNLASMRTLGELGVLSGSLVEEMAQGARFRNVLSHTYGNIIDHDIVYTGELPGKGFKPFANMRFFDVHNARYEHVTQIDLPSHPGAKDDSPLPASRVIADELCRKVAPVFDPTSILGQYSS